MFTRPHQIKVYSTNKLKTEFLEKLIHKMKDTLVMSTIANGNKNRCSVHVCVVYDCSTIGMGKVEIIGMNQLLINLSKCVCQLVKNMMIGSNSMKCMMII